MNTALNTCFTVILLTVFGCDDASDSTTLNSDPMAVAGGGGRAPLGGASNTTAAGASALGGNSGVAISPSQMLDSIGTLEQAGTLCQLLEARLKRTEYDKMVAGICAVEGQVAAAQGEATCELARRACVADRSSGLGTKQDCVPEDFPRCSNVSIEEFIACTDAMIHESALYFGTFNCESDLSSITDEFVTPAVCTALYERCPAMANGEVL